MPPIHSYLRLSDTAGIRKILPSFMLQHQLVHSFFLLHKILTMVPSDAANQIRQLLRWYERKQKHSRWSGVHVRLRLTPKDRPFLYVHSLKNKMMQARQREGIESLLCFHFYLKRDWNIPESATQLKGIALAWFAPFVRHVICAYLCHNGYDKPIPEEEPVYHPLLVSKLNSH